MPFPKVLLSWMYCYWSELSSPFSLIIKALLANVLKKFLTTFSHSIFSTGWLKWLAEVVFFLFVLFFSTLHYTAGSWVISLEANQNSTRVGATPCHLSRPVPVVSKMKLTWYDDNSLKLVYLLILVMFPHKTQNVTDLGALKLEPAWHPSLSL